MPTPTTAPQLLNISTRLKVLTNDNVLIGGFILTGSQSKTIIVRGTGPSLTAAGVSGALADPVLELHEQDGTVVTNDNWKDTQESVISATGLAPTNPLESAVVATLAPGAYTVILSGKNGAPGLAWWTPMTSMNPPCPSWPISAHAALSIRGITS